MYLPCDGGRLDSWQKTPPSVFPPPDTSAISTPEIRERLVSFWLCNLHSEELSSTWMWTTVLKKCILGGVSVLSIPTNRFITAIKSWLQPLVCIYISVHERRHIQSLTRGVGVTKLPSTAPWTFGGWFAQGDLGSVLGRSRHLSCYNPPLNI